MKLLQMNNYEFTVLLETTEKLHSLRCELFEKDPDPGELYYRIKAGHLKPLFGSADNEFMTGEIGKDTIYLSMVFKMEGVFFECAYYIDMNSGEVRFAMDKPLINLKDFVIPAEFEEDLKDRINELKGQDKLYESFNDERLDKYFSDKYLRVFLDYVGYMERLVKNNRCDKCGHRFKYRLSGFCDGLYSKNRFDY